MLPNRKAKRTSKRARLMCFSSEEGSLKNWVASGVGEQKWDGHIFASPTSVPPGRKANMPGQHSLLSERVSGASAYM